MKKTPLYNEHEKLGGRIVPFAGWQMPVEYSGIRDEHHTVRSAAGLFDVSHMGEIRVTGPKAFETLQWLTTNDVAKLEKGQAQYSLLPNPEGGLVDDLIVYCLEPNEDYLLCVNASNTDKDWAHIQEYNRGADLTNESSFWGQVALQGPKAFDILRAVFDGELSEIKPFCFQQMIWQGTDIVVARTGYTGEDGVEIFVPWNETESLWLELLEKGGPLGLKPCGLGARDTLRTEMKYSLYGQEIDDVINPYSAGLGWVIKPTAKDFVGKGPMLAGKEKGLPRKLVGFKMVEKGIPRHGYTLVDIDKKPIGTVTSGTVSPSLNENIGLGYVDKAHSDVGREIWVDIRGRAVKALVASTPFVKK